MEVQSLNPSTWEIEAGNLCEFETSLVYTSSFRLARATIVRPLLKKKSSLVSLTFCIMFSVLWIFILIFIVYFLLPILSLNYYSLVCLLFSNFLCCKFRLLLLRLSSFLCDSLKLGGFLIVASILFCSFSTHRHAI